MTARTIAGAVMALVIFTPPAGARPQPALISRGSSQLVVRSHEMVADCGSSKVTVFTSSVGGSVVPAVSIGNPCDLTAAIGSDDNSLVLRGPYYAPDAPLCCPTKPHASSVLRYRNGKWVESPNYFKITS